MSIFQKLSRFSTAIYHGLGLLAVLETSCTHTTPGISDWQPLLDSDLSQWDCYLSYRLSPRYDGDPPCDSSGRVIPPVGFNADSFCVFTTHQEAGETILRISGEYYGALISKKPYYNYHLRFQVKWGEQKWDPRKEKSRDSGLLYHSIGEPGVEYWRTWMLSQEFQVMEGHMGDYWPQARSATDIRAFAREGTINAIADHNQPFLPFGYGTQNGFHCLRSQNAELPNGRWNTLELICFDDMAFHIVNGVVVMELCRSRYIQNGNEVPLLRGKLQLQSEAAEVFYKNIEIRPLDRLPELPGWSRGE